MEELYLKVIDIGEIGIKNFKIIEGFEKQFGDTYNPNADCHCQY